MRMHWEIVAGAVAPVSLEQRQPALPRKSPCATAGRRVRKHALASRTRPDHYLGDCDTRRSGNGSVESSMSQVFRTIVEDVAADGTATLRQVIESVRMELNSPLGRTVFDSASKDSDPTATPLSQTMSAAYSAMIGQPLTMVVSPRGTVQKIEGMARLMERVLNAQPQDRIAPRDWTVFETLSATTLHATCWAGGPRRFLIAHSILATHGRII